MGKKSSANTASKVSSAHAPAASSNNTGSNRSSLLRTSFSPSSLQLHLFASVIQSFDSHKLQIYDTNSGRLRQQHAAPANTAITSLTWGVSGSTFVEDVPRNGNKKRKRVSKAADNCVIAYGTSTSQICLYSHTEDRILQTLSGAHEGEIKDFRFSHGISNEAWSIGGDAKLVQWDLSRNQPIRSITLPETTISILGTPVSRSPQIICASTTPFSIHTSEDVQMQSFDSFRSQVCSLHRSKESTTDLSDYFLAADNDRFINVFDVKQRKIVRTLVTGSEVEQLDLFLPNDHAGTLEEQLLAAVTRDGEVDLFFRPFKLPVVVNGDARLRHKSMTRKANAQVRLVNDSGKPSKIVQVSIQGPELVIVSVDGGIIPYFQTVRWQDEGTGQLLFEGVKEVVRDKRPSALNGAQMNGVKDMGRTHVDESRTVVIEGSGDLGSEAAAIEISSGDEDQDSERGDRSEAEREADKDDDVSGVSETEEQPNQALTLHENTDITEDTQMVDPADREPSFGDLLASKHPGTIAIADSFPSEKSKLDTRKQLALPSGMSLATVLTQALRTNDTNLLESCLHANDAGIIQNTIQRLDSYLAARLLTKLAERLASRPGRYGHLISWVQWTCIAHGGAIAGQPDIAVRIRTLYRVLSQRSKSLDRLLLLKGKLDMLSAQLSLRKQGQAFRSDQTQDQGEPGMIYIEGEQDNWSSEEDVDEAVGVVRSSKRKNQNSGRLDDLVKAAESSESEDGDDDNMPNTNGVVSESSDEGDSDEGMEIGPEAKSGLYDLEAAVSGEEDESEDDDQGDDLDDSEDEGEDEEDDDSSMDDFINDGEISYASDEDQSEISDEIEIRKPQKKRSKY